MLFCKHFFFTEFGVPPFRLNFGGISPKISQKKLCKKISKGGEGAGVWVRNIVFDSFPVEQAVRIVITKRLRITPQDGS